MNIENERPVMIFRRDRDGKINYVVGLSKKNEEGEYDRAYFPIRFKRGIEIENKTKILLINAFLTFDNWTDAEGNNKTFTYIMCTSYQLADEEEPKPKSGNTSFKADEIELSDDDFPF